MPSAVNQSFLDTRHFSCGVLYVSGKLECNRAKGTRGNEFDFNYSGRVFFDALYHVHFSEAHACLGVGHFAHFFTDFAFKICQFFQLTNLSDKICKSLTYKVAST